VGEFFGFFSVFEKFAGIFGRSSLPGPSPAQVEPERDLIGIGFFVWEARCCTW